MKITGNITISFSSSIIPLLVKNSSPSVLKFDVNGTNSLEQIFPVKALVEKCVFLIQCLGDVCCELCLPCR